MKKLLLLIALVILSNCEIKPRESVAQSTRDQFYNAYYHYQYHEEQHQGMTYGIWSLNSNNASSQTGYTVEVINLTKDALEVELLRKQLAAVNP